MQVAHTDSLEDYVFKITRNGSLRSSLAHLLPGL